MPGMQSGVPAGDAVEAAAEAVGGAMAVAVEVALG